MKKYSLMILLLNTMLFAGNSDELVEKLHSLEQTNQKQQQLIQDLQEQLDEMDEHIEEVETSTLVDKINLNLGFISKVDNYEKKYADGSKVSSNNLYSSKVMLGLKAKITKNMKFTGRLSMYKYWADSTKHGYANYDNMQGRVPSDSSVYFERAYLDWYFHAGVPSALTIGRQPSADGPSHQFKENTTRKSTYSALVFDGASDGIVYTADVSKTTGIKNAKVRFAYGKGFQNDETKMGVSNAFIGNSSDTLKDTNVFGGFFESNFLGLDRSLFQLGYVQMHDVIANAMEIDADKNKNLGAISYIGIMAEATNFKESGYDLFAHVGLSHAKPSGEVYTYANRQFSLMQDDLNNLNSKDGYAFWIGGRYSFANSLKLGAEYNHGSKYWITATQGSYDTLNKLATRGDAYEAYGIYPINRYSFIKFGGVFVDYEYTRSGCYLIPPQKISTLPSDMSASELDSIQNIYLQLSVHY